MLARPARLPQFVDGSSSWLRRLGSPPQARLRPWPPGHADIWLDPFADRPGGLCAADHRAQRFFCPGGCGAAKPSCSWLSPQACWWGLLSALLPTRAVQRHRSADRQPGADAGPVHAASPATQRLENPGNCCAGGPWQLGARALGPFGGQTRPPQRLGLNTSATLAVHLTTAPTCCC